MLLSGICLIVISGFFILWLFLSSVVNGTEEEKFTLKIKKGMSLNAIINVMLEDNIIQNKDKLVVVARILGCRGKIKAGKYEISGGISSYLLLRKLVDGKMANEWVTIPEGKHSRQIASIMMKKVDIDSARFMQLVNDPNYVRKLGLDAATLEGFLYPNTYRLNWGMKCEQIIPILVNQFKRQFNDTLIAKTKEMGFSVTEILALASIIEGEAIIDSEREIISAVYHNRLRRRIPLQADPTIQYIIKDSPRRLLKKDLAINSPYNTYKYYGLPPGPINNPGIASIRASLFPAKVRYLYFVANGDGSHTFSTTLKQHIRAKARFDEFRKKIKQKKRMEGKDG